MIGVFKYVLFVLILFSCIFGQTSRYNFPNPMKNPVSCGRIKASYVCDPDQIFRSEFERDKLQYLLLQIRQQIKSKIRCPDGTLRGFQGAVAVIDRMERLPGESVSSAAKNYAKTIGDSWGVGDPQCGNGFLIFLSRDDRAVHIFTAPNTRKYVTDEAASSIISKMKPYFVSGEYGNGSLYGLHLIKNRLVDHGPNSSNFGSNLVKILFICACIAIPVFILYKIYQRKKEENRARRALENILSDLDNSVGRPATGDEVLRNSTCPICLDDFGAFAPSAPPLDPNEQSQDGTTNAENKNPMHYPYLNEPSAPLPPTNMEKYNPPHLTPATTANSNDAAYVLQTEQGAAHAQTTSNEVHDVDSNPRAPRTLMCGHCFHGECIAEWLREHSQCPLCRAEVGSDGRGHVVPAPSSLTAPEARDQSGDRMQRRASYYAQRFYELYPRIVLGMGGMQILHDLLSTPHRNNQSYFDGTQSYYRRTDLSDALRGINLSGMQNTLSNFDNMVRNSFDQVNFGGGSLSQSIGNSDAGGAGGRW